MNPQSKILQEQIIEHIETWDPVWGQDHWDDERFNVLARALFNYQYTQNAPYRSFCDGRGITPDHVQSFEQIPAVPTDVFKLVALHTEPLGSGVMFQTSGTTQGQRGTHHMASSSVYEASLLGPFIRHCMPDAQRRRLLMLHPSSADLPTSSLSYMFSQLKTRCGTDDSAHFVGIVDGQWAWDIDGLERAFNDAVEKGEAVVVLGTAFGLMHVIDSTTTSWQLPPGSTLMETGGFKGRSRTLSKEDLYHLFDARFGIHAERCVSEYSMTELSAQSYTDNVHQLLLNQQRLNLSDRRLRTPPWARVVAVDPVSLAPILSAHDPTEGLLCWYDLSNMWSVMAVQTSDRGVVYPDGGFTLLGRADDAQLRGCSLTIEEIQAAIEHSP